MKNKKFFAFMALFMLLVACAIFFYEGMAISNMEEDAELTNELPSRIKEMFYEKDIYDYDYRPNVDKIASNNHIIVKGQYYTATDGKSYSIAYDNSLNVLNGTHELMVKNKNAIDAIVYLEFGHKNLGTYYTDNLLGENTTTNQKALQPYYVINYLDIASKTIFKRDTVFGTKPNERKRSSDSWVGEEPTESEIVDRLREMLTK